MGQTNSLSVVEEIQREIEAGKYNAAYMKIISSLSTLSDEECYYLVYSVLLDCITTCDTAIVIWESQLKALLDVPASRDDQLKLFDAIIKSGHLMGADDLIQEFYGDCTDVDRAILLLDEGIVLDIDYNIFKDRILDRMRNNTLLYHEWRIINEINFTDDEITEIMDIALPKYLHNILFAKYPWDKFWKCEVVSKKIRDYIMDRIDIDVCPEHYVVLDDSLPTYIANNVMQFVRQGIDVKSLLIALQLIRNGCPIEIPPIILPHANYLLLHNADFTWIVNYNIPKDCVIKIIHESDSNNSHILAFHSLVICSFSEMLRGCIHGNFKESNEEIVKFIDPCPETVKNVLISLYSGIIMLKDRDFFEIMDIVRVLDKLLIKYDNKYIQSCLFNIYVKEETTRLSIIEIAVEFEYMELLHAIVNFTSKSK